MVLHQRVFHHFFSQLCEVGGGLAIVPHKDLAKFGSSSKRNLSRFVKKKNFATLVHQRLWHKFN